MPSRHETIAAPRELHQVALAPAEPYFSHPFTPFEFYFQVEHLPDYPQVFHIQLDCRGQVDREAFVRAYQLAHQRHPLLSADIESDRRGWPKWTPGEAAPVLWGNATSWSEAGLNCSASSPRVVARVIEDGDETALRFTFDHIAVDGMGGFQFISDLLVAYAHLLSGQEGPPEWRRLDPALLKERGRHTLFSRKLRPIDLARLPRVSMPLMMRKAALVSDQPRPEVCGKDVDPSAEFLVHTLTQEQTAGLSRVARAQEVRLHDLLLRDYFLMLTAWNRGTPEARLPMRVLVPTNMRRQQDFRMPAANLFGFTFMTRKAKHCQDRRELLASIRREMAAMKSTRWALYHELGLQMFTLWPRLLQWSVRRKWTFATAVFTNLNAGFDHVPLPWHGDRRLAGNLVVENGYGAGPIRPDTRMSLAIHSYAGRISVAVTSDRKIFGPDQQQALLEAYLDQLRVTTDSGT